MQIRKRDWTEQGPLLKARINAKLSVYQSVARLKIKSLASLDMEGKTSKRLVLETLALLVDAAESCLLSVWRKLRVCEELFSSLLAGIAQIAVIRGGQPLRVLLIRLKPLVLTACAQVLVVLWVCTMTKLILVTLEIKLFYYLLSFLCSSTIYLWQGDTWGSSKGAMFETVMKTSCEIIESGWTKDRAPVDTFIMGLATSIRERNDYDEQVICSFFLWYI